MKPPKQIITIQVPCIEMESNFWSIQGNMVSIYFNNCYSGIFPISMCYYYDSSQDKYLPITRTMLQNLKHQEIK